MKKPPPHPAQVALTWPSCAMFMNYNVIIWNMIVKGVPYKTENDYEFPDLKRKRKLQEIKSIFISLM